MNRALPIAKFLAFALVVACLIALPTLMFAQSVVTGDLSGTVTDPSGAVVSGAVLTLKSADDGSSQSTVTNGSGGYRFVLLKPGAYNLGVTQKSFKMVSMSVAVTVGQVNTFNVKLEVGSAAEVVEVNGGTALVQTDNANLTTTFSTAQIDSIPVPGGDITSYAYSAPGVVMNTAAGYGNFSSFGLPSTANLFTVNGGDMNDQYLNLNDSGASNLMLGANELDQIAVVANGYTAQYGRQAGAQLNSTTKSGSNGLHGNAEYWWNGTKLNANDWFTNDNADPTARTRPHAVNNQWATSVGGPIKKDKAFFFADYEGLRFVLPGASGVNYLPTPAFATQVLSTVNTTTPGSLAFYQNIFSLYAGSSGAASATPVSLATDSSLGCGDWGSPGGAGVALGFGNQGTVANPVAGKPCSMQFTSGANNLNTEWLFSGRLDYNFSDKDRLFGRYWMDRGVQATGTDPINNIFNAESIQPQYAGQINETHIFNSTTVNQVILGGFWYKALFTANNLSGALAAFPTTMAFNDGLMTTLGGGDFNYPQGRIPTQYQITDDFSKSVGNHDFKFGVNFRRVLISDYALGVNTSGTLSINSMTEFVNGASGGASDLSKAFANTGTARIKMYNVGFYGQDQWKVSSKLSLTGAIRIDRTGNPACAQNCYSRLVSPFATISHDPTVPYNQVIQTGLNKAFPQIEKSVLAPRMGLTYSVRPSTVIRGGIGTFSDLFPGFIIDQYITNSPNVSTFDASSGAFSPAVAGNLFAVDAGSNAAFNSGFANGFTLAQFQAAFPGFSAPGFNSSSSKLLNPKFLEYNLQVEQQLGTHYSASLNWVGNHGYDLIMDNPWLNAYCKSNCPFGGVGSVVPDTRFGQVRELQNTGWSNYNGVTATFNARTKSLQTQFNYTWSHDLDTCSNNCLLPFSASTVTSIRYQTSPMLPGTAYGNSDYDVRNNISANYVYNSKADWSSGLMNHVVGGWTVAGTLFFHSGYPWSPVSTAVRGSLGNVTPLRRGTPLAEFAVAPDTLPSCSNPNTPCATASDFVSGATQAGFGNYARNTLRGPRFFDTDLNLEKNFKITEHMGFAIGASFFNILNHPNFDLPNNNVAVGNFGSITNTVSPATTPYGAFLSVPLTGRIIQLNSKFTF